MSFSSVGTRCSDRERTVSESPLRPWKKRLPLLEARSGERVGMSATGVSRSEIYSLVCGLRMSCERVDTASTRSVAQWVTNATRGGRELHGHVVSYRERVSLPRSGLAAAVPELPLEDRRGQRCSSPVATAREPRQSCRDVTDGFR